MSEFTNLREYLENAEGIFLQWGLWVLWKVTEQCGHSTPEPRLQMAWGEAVCDQPHSTGLVPQGFIEEGVPGLQQVETGGGVASRRHLRC